MDQDGAIQWQRALGGTLDDHGFDVIATSDGGYAIIGGTFSNDGDVTGNHGDGDAWLVKLDANGALQWQLALGGSEEDSGVSLVETGNGSLGFVGSTRLNDGDVEGNNGALDLWIVVVDGTGDIDWQRCLGGTSIDEGRSVSISASGGFLVAGGSASNDGDVANNHGGAADGWLVHVNDAGELTWQRCLGGSGWDFFTGAVELGDGSTLATGFTDSNDGDVSGSHGLTDGGVVRFDATGELSSEYALGGTMTDVMLDIEPTADGGCVVAGWTQSSDGDISNFLGVRDSWLVRFNAQGGLVWERTYGGSDNDGAYAVCPADNGGYALLSSTRSVGGETGTGLGNFDYWLMKTTADPVGVEDRATEYQVVVSPNPATTFVQVDLGHIMPANGAMPADWYDAAGRHLGAAVPMPAFGGGGVASYSLEDLPVGLLVLRIRSHGSHYIARVTKW